MCPNPNFVFTRILSSGPNFVFKLRLRAQFELQLLANHFVFKSFGISSSGPGRNRDPVFRSGDDYLIMSVFCNDTLLAGAAHEGSGHTDLSLQAPSQSIAKIKVCTCLSCGRRGVAKRAFYVAWLAEELPTGTLIYSLPTPDWPLPDKSSPQALS